LLKIIKNKITDIICLNAEPKEKIDRCKYSTYSYYKFDCVLCYLQFYIIKNSSLEKIFKNIYPIVDQIDILIGKMHNILNIYNITKTTDQKKFITNTQNNLHIIHNTQSYAVLVKKLNQFENECEEYLKKYLNIDHEICSNITKKL